MPRWKQIRYDDLNPRQRENYNFQKISSLLADFGYATIRLSDDWNGADFVAVHLDGEVLKVQLKGRLCFSKSYARKDLWIAFREEDDWYLYPHDLLLGAVLDSGQLAGTKSWETDGSYSFPYLSEQNATLLEPYRLPLVNGSDEPPDEAANIAANGPGPVVAGAGGMPPGGGGKDHTKYDLTIGGVVRSRLPKKRLIFHIVSYLAAHGVSPAQIENAVAHVDSRSLFRPPAAITDETRFFCAPDELIDWQGQPVAFTTQWGTTTLPALQALQAAFPGLMAGVHFEPA